VYARTVGDSTLSFGVSGMLWRDNLVMYDRETDTWWAQATGEAIRGTLRGQTLSPVASQMMTWRQWRATYPSTRVLAPPAGQERPRRDVYAGYHGSGRIGVTGRTRSAGALDAKARVLGFRVGSAAYAVTVDDRTPPVRQGDAGGQAVLVVLTPDREGGRVFLPGTRTFVADGDADGRTMLKDLETGSRWDGLDGIARSGPQEGRRLDSVAAHISYWFSWHSFFPDTVILPAQ
jgi:hypothetical protein